MNASTEHSRAVEAIRQQFAQKKKQEQVIFDKNAKEKDRMMAIRLLRNYPHTGGIDSYLQFVGDEGNPDSLRVIMAEALGWFNHSVERPAIINGCKTLLEKEQPSELKAELIQTINRLQ